MQKAQRHGLASRSIDMSACLQARAVFAICCTLGVRTPFFQYWQWQEVELLKVPMVRHEVVADVEALSRDDRAQLSVRPFHLMHVVTGRALQSVLVS